MRKLSAWINAARLRTLPLSVSGILVGTAIADIYGNSDPLLFFLAVLTAIGFQITSNFANDYGDGIKGTDNENRIGPQRALQSGLLSKEELKRGIIVSIAINVLLILGVIYIAFGLNNIEYLITFFTLGAISIWAAIKYTVGNSAYGYRGLGDLFVFVFFGLLSVMGTAFLHLKQVYPLSILVASSIGLLSVGVLNLNNLRDHESDRASQKNTLIVKMGYDNGIRYHTLLIILGLGAMLTFVLLFFECWAQLVPLLLFVPILMHLNRVRATKNPALLDPELKKLAIGIFLMSLLFYMTNNIFCNFEL